MKTIEIHGLNSYKTWEIERTACRGLVVKNGKLLLSYETVTDQYMIPGGGLEDGEDEKTCLIREMEEETGLLVAPSDCLLEIDEYYEEWKFVSRYFICKVTGEGKISMTEREIEVGMEPRWLPIEEITEIFSKHADYTDTDEMRRGMYLREYTALQELMPLLTALSEH
ncbi:MAG: NUDIX domain-containing protein [Clostridiales bacterium]|nr:NUDIX domain-containing protein [Clostridiales bacterium]